MAYSNAAAVLRPDIMGVIEQGNLPGSVFIGEQVAPVFNSATKTGQYPVFKPAISDNMSNDAAKRARATSYPRVNRSYTYDTFACDDIGLEEVIDDAHDRADLGRFFDVEVATTRRAVQQQKINYEIAVAAQILSTSQTATAAAVNYTETNIATINFVKDVQGAARRLLALGKVPNAVVMSDTLFHQVVRSTLFRSYLPGGVFAADVSQLATPALMGRMIGIPNVWVGSAYYNSAAKNKTLSASSIWGTTYYYVGVVQGGPLLDSGSARSIVWQEDAASLFQVETYRDETIRSDVVRVRQNYTVKLVDSTAGQLITTSYSAS